MSLRRPRLLHVLAGTLAVTLAVVIPACLNNGPDEGGGDLAVVLDSGGTGDLAHRTFDLANVDSALPPANADLSKPILDLSLGDLTGLFNCYNVAICDPNQMFCIKFFQGSAADPGKMLVGSPACYEPSDTCANQGQNMDCGCIQNDANLGASCQGSCVDNMDGTFTCYAQ